MIRRPPRSTRVRSSAASDVYKRQGKINPFQGNRSEEHGEGGCWKYMYQNEPRQPGGWNGTLSEGATILTVTENGYGKRTRTDEYPVQLRGGMGVLTIKTTCLLYTSPSPRD